MILKNKKERRIEMLKLEKTYVGNFEGALRGMRNPLNSWDKSDTVYNYDTHDNFAVIGPNDLDLALRLIKGGTSHRKFLRQIQVCVDITAPMFWWKEYDTYKVATVRNSCSTMHKIHSREILIDDFSVENLDRQSQILFEQYVIRLNQLRNEFNETKDKSAWRQLIEMLPSSYNQMSTCTLNYEALMAIHEQRRHHKLTEWHTFCDWTESLPYMSNFLGLNTEN